ncbi:MAG: transcriptional repressor [Candidatus Omnitrophica bacterium]|nr:transcriptional repressor [Candidatus Omnitrophota bacterium]
MRLEKSQDFTQLFSQKCAEHGLKITPQRSAVCAELMKAKDHPTADAVYKRVREKLPNISFDTVYRTLLLFTELGIISLVEGYGEQKRFEPNLHQHHHFRCVKCRKIFDFESDTYDQIAVPKEARNYGTVIHKRVVLEGVCARCRRT